LGEIRNASLLLFKRCERGGSEIFSQLRSGEELKRKSVYKGLLILDFKFKIVLKRRKIENPERGHPFVNFFLGREICRQAMMESYQRGSPLPCRNKQRAVAVFLKEEGFAAGDEPLSLLGLSCPDQRLPFFKESSAPLYAFAHIFWDRFFVLRDQEKMNRWSPFYIIKGIYEMGSGLVSESLCSLKARDIYNGTTGERFRAIRARDKKENQKGVDQ
jgi:hypothetical protein